MATTDDATCPHCEKIFRPPDKGEARCCGRSPCYELTYWTDDDWAGQARMAEARAAAGTTMTEAGVRYQERGGDQYTFRFRTFAMGPAELSELDRLALSRTSPPSP